MPTCRPVLATLLLAATVAAQAEQATPVRLATELRTGETFVFTVSVDSSSKFEDSKKDVAMSMCLTFTASVGARDAEATKVECRLDRLRLRATAPNVQTEYDSSSPLPDSGPLQKLRELTGTTFLLRIADNGHVTEVKKPQLLDATAEDSLGADFRTLFSAWFVALPQEPMAVGTSWNGSSKLFGVLPGEKETATIYRLSSVEGYEAVIHATYKPQPPTTRPGVTFELRESEGSVTVDVARRRVVHTEAHLLARATRSKGSETATSTIVMRACEGEEPRAHGAVEPATRTQAAKPQR